LASVPPLEGNGKEICWEDLLSNERYTPESWQRQYSPVPDWDETFRNGQWKTLGDLSQTARHAVIAGYVHKLVRRGHVLDAGCGEGVLIEYFDPARIEYTGFDISPTAIQRAKERHPGLRLSSCPIEAFAPPDGVKYDVVIFNDSLSTLKHPLEMVDRYASFLTPSGFIIVSQYQPADPSHNGAVLTRMFEAELEAGRYHMMVRSEVLNPDTDRTWRSYCLMSGETGGKRPESGSI
jgi:2-polyprenyl-3-methyl-5-hydroxy-6-metoxy-1,4-benzoquinol methylase